MNSVDFATIRQIISTKKHGTLPEKLMIIIKPGKDSNFKTLVNVMDEMTIHDVKHYAMVDPETFEYEIMQKH